MTDENILVTGATGAFGRYVVRELLNYPGQLTLLVRAENDRAARSRVEAALGHKLDRHTVTVLQSDLTDSKLGLAPAQYSALSQRVTAVVHAAAPTRFDLSLTEARASITATTRHLINFALAAKHLTKFGYISTAYAAGKQTGQILEDVLLTKEFVNSYDQSKYEAETYVRSQQDTLPLAIYRPSLIVSADCGDNNAAIMVLKLARKGWLPLLPGEPSDQVDIISAREAAEATCELFTNHFHPGQTYHITSGPAAPRLNEILSIVKHPKLTYTGHNPVRYQRLLGQVIDQEPSLQLVYRKLEPVIGYLMYPKQFSNQKTTAALGHPLGQDNVLAILEHYLAAV
jgi:thioester reductase-like protein